VRILIISTFFPPRNVIASQRPYVWAKTWARAGHDVTVLTTRKVPREGDDPQPTAGFNVLEVNSPLLNLIGKHYKQKNNDAPKGTQANYKLTHKILTAALKPLRDRGVLALARFPDTSEAWVKPALEAARNLPPFDLVVSTGWPYTVHRIAYALRTIGHANGWVMDWRDLWVDNPMYPGLPFFAGYERRLERKWHAAANLITTVSDPLADTLRGLTGTPVVTIMNGVDLEEMQSVDGEQSPPVDAGVKRLVYTGTYYPGWCDANPLFAAIAELNDSGVITPNQFRVDLIGYCHEMLPEAAHHGVAAYIQHHGYLPRVDSIRMQRDADALLFLDLNADAAEGIMTGKIFEYLYWRKPIWSVGGTGRSGTGPYVVGNGGLELNKDVQRIKEAILNLVNAPSLPLGVERDLRFSRERQAEQLLVAYREQGRRHPTLEVS
jgi:glycosyltransferase involved in cell wall biosynthesis